MGELEEELLRIVVHDRDIVWQGAEGDRERLLDLLDGDVAAGTIEPDHCDIGGEEHCLLLHLGMADVMMESLGRTVGSPHRETSHNA